MIKTKANIYFYKHGEVTKKFIINNYRPAFGFKNINYLISGAIRFENVKKIHSGIQQEVNILFINDDEIRKTVLQGEVFGIYEGSTKLGEGEVLSVLSNDDIGNIPN